MKQILRIPLLLTFVFGLLVARPAHASGKPYTLFAKLKHPEDDKNPKNGSASTANNSATRTMLSSRNNSAVKIQPHMFRKEMTVIARENGGKEIDFFVFDLQGTLVHNVRMKEKDRIKIMGLSRGKYIYRVFAGDEETASGQFEIR
jgi:hypothetical protein